MILFTWNAQKSKSIDTEKIDYILRKLEWVGNGVWLLTDTEFSLEGDKAILKLNSGNAWITL